MQRKIVKKNGYCAGKGKTNQELIYLHMSNHYRRILNAKKVIDNSPPHSYKTKRPATSNPAVARNKLNRPLDSPALTDRSASTNSYKGSFWGMESCPGSSRYHAQCIASDSANVSAPADRVGLDMNLINRITYDTKHGPAAYCDEGWMEVKPQDNRKMYQPALESKQNKGKMDSSSNPKSRPPTKGSDESAQKQKFVVQRKLKADDAGNGSKCFASSNRDRFAKASKTEAVSKLRSLRVYYPPRRKKTRIKAESSPNPLETSSCDCTKICVCDTNETVFKKTSTNGKEQSQTSSRDSAYNGGVSSLPESRSPTPDHRRKVECCCCCCERKQRDVILESKAVGGSPRVRDPSSGPPTPKSKVQQQESLKKMKEDALYVKFLQDITMEVLERNLYTNKALKKVMKKHLRNNLHKLNKERMLQEVENLRIQLGIPEDKALLEFEADAEEGSIDTLRPYPVISDSEFRMPKNLIEGNEKNTTARVKGSPKAPRSISEVYSVLAEKEKSAFVSETDEEEVISVIQMKKAIGEKRKETRGGKGGARAGQEHSSDDSDRPSDPKKRSTSYGVKPTLFRMSSSSSSDSDMGEKPSRKARDKIEGEVSPSEELCLREFAKKGSNTSMDRKNRSVSFWNNPDLSVGRTRTIEIKRKETLTCTRSSSPENEQRRK